MLRTFSSLSFSRGYYANKPNCLWTTFWVERCSSLNSRGTSSRNHLSFACVCPKYLSQSWQTIDPKANIKLKANSHRDFNHLIVGAKGNILSTSMINSKGINLRIDNPMESTQTISQFLPGEWRRNQLGNRPVINSPISISS